MVTTKKFMRNVHDPLQDGVELNIIADAVIQQFDAFIVQLDAMKASVQIDTATGLDLDNIGANIGLTRDIGESDISFRARIKAYFPGLSGSGTITELKATINRITDVPEENITITEIESAKFRVTVDVTELNELIETIQSIVWESKSAGTYPFFLIQPTFNETVEVTENYQILPNIGIFFDIYEFGGAEVL